MFFWLQYLVDWLIYGLLPFDRQSALAAAINFFLFDSVKIFILLFIIIMVITFIRSFFSPERTRKILSEKKGSRLLGHFLAGGLGIITPFCSCSAVPLFIGFVEAGIPLGVTFTYLIAAPMINEVALGLLYSLFGLKIALVYVLTGEVIAIVSGLIIGRLHLESSVEGYVYEIKIGVMAESGPTITLTERLRDAGCFTFDLIHKIWLYVVIGIAIGAVMHGWIPAGALARYAGKDNPLAVLLAVLIGIPLYSNAAGVIPLVSELTRAGVAMGTALAFMMSVTALSIPEMILLRKVLKPRLLIIFVSIVGTGIVLTGYLFNQIL
jgi:uncharacterized membrane protein YraQ (UPF0718 family)